jgi:hypothetical protein
MADNTQKMSFQAGEAKGQVQVSLWIFFYFFLFIYECSCMIFLFQYMIRYEFCLFQEKASTLMDRAGNAAQSAKESVQEVQIFSFNLIFYVF